MTQILELAQKDFQVEVLTILSGIKENMLIMNKNQIEPNEKLKSEIIKSPE